MEPEAEGGNASKPCSTLETMLVLATSTNALELSEEDYTLLDALAALGVPAKLVAWDDPSFEWAHASHVLIRTTWDYHLRLPEFLAWLDRVSASATIWNSPALIRWNSDKRYLLELQEKGVPIVESLAATEPIDVAVAAEAMNWPSIVIKPTVAAGAYETLVFELPENTAAAQAHFERLIAKGTVLIQPYIDGIVVEGETSLVFFDGFFSHAVKKKPKAGDFRVQIEFGGKYTVVEPTPAQTETAERIMAALPETPLYARIDLVDVEGHPRLMELELIEPELFFLFVPEAAVEFADIVRERIAEHTLR